MKHVSTFSLFTLLIVTKESATLQGARGYPSDLSYCRLREDDAKSSSSESCIVSLEEISIKSVRRGKLVQLELPQ